MEHGAINQNKITKHRDVIQGGTKPWGDIEVGRNFYPKTLSKDDAYLEMLTTLYHEQVHMIIAPKILFPGESSGYL